MGIKARRDQHQIWLEMIGGGNEYLPERLFKGDISGVFRQRHIDVVTLAEPAPYFVQISRAGIERCCTMGVKK